MSLPIPIITANFAKFYRQGQKKDRAIQRKKRLQQVLTDLGETVKEKILSTKKKRRETELRIFPKIQKSRK